MDELYLTNYGYLFDKLKKKVLKGDELNKSEALILRMRKQLFTYYANYNLEDSSYYKNYQIKLANDMARFSLFDEKKGIVLHKTAFDYANRPFLKKFNSFQNKINTYEHHLSTHNKIYDEDTYDILDANDVIKIELSTDDDNINVSDDRMKNYEN